MTDQRNEAAERSAHVLRGAAQGEVLGPCVEVSPGVWRLRALVEVEARIAELEQERDDCEREKKTAAAIWGATTAEINAAFARGAEAMREVAVKACRTRAYALTDSPAIGVARLGAVADSCADLISALSLPEGGE